MVTKDELSLGGGHTVRYTEHVTQKCTLETYIILLTNVTPINLIKSEKRNDNSNRELFYIKG